MGVKRGLAELSHEDFSEDRVAEKTTDIGTGSLTMVTDQANFSLTLTKVVSDAVDTIGIISDFSVRVQMSQDEIT